MTGASRGTPQLEARNADGSRMSAKLQVVLTYLLMIAVDDGCLLMRSVVQATIEASKKPHRPRVFLEVAVGPPGNQKKGRIEVTTRLMAHRAAGCSGIVWSLE